MSNRLARINEQLKREISQILRREVRDPRIGVVTVSAVDVAADLAVADVYIRTLGSDAEVARSLEGLGAAAPFVRRELGKVLHLRQIPELRFREDRSLEHARRIEEILSQVLPPEEEGGPGDVDATGGSDPGEPGSDPGEAGSGDGDERGPG